MQWPGGRSPLVPVSGSLGPASRSTCWGTRNCRVLPSHPLGPVRLTGYQERLHAWAKKYGQRGWPAGSPEYLLHGYFRLLQDTADLPRLMACATDQRRHDRMLEITGGDTAALNEITALQHLLLRVQGSDFRPWVA